MAPLVRSNPTARRRRNHLEFFKIFMNIGMELSILSMGHSIERSPLLRKFPDEISVPTQNTIGGFNDSKINHFQLCSKLYTLSHRQRGQFRPYVYENFEKCKIISTARRG